MFVHQIVFVFMTRVNRLLLTMSDKQNSYIRWLIKLNKNIILVHFRITQWHMHHACQYD
jgi:hypothetical protein